MASGRRSRVRSNRALSPSPPNARYRDNARGVMLRVDFTVESEAIAFAEAFGGNLIR
jgi:hypothetical protein